MITCIKFFCQDYIKNTSVDILRGCGILPYAKRILPLMIIHFQQAKFLISAAQLSQLPADQGAEVAFVGRSNVGKSSALNTLTRQKGLARTSKIPGRTQLLNFFSLNTGYRLVDLPGYGYSKVPKEIKQRWEKILGKYLELRKSLKGIILLMDIRHPLKEFDRMMLDWSNHHAIPIHILLTKADKLSRNQILNTLSNVKKNLTMYDTVSIQPFSSLSRAGLSELEIKITEWLGAVDNSLD